MKTRNITSKLMGINLDWAGTWEELLEQAYLHNVWVRKTGGVYAGGNPEVDIIGEAEDIDRFMEVYSN